MFKPRGDKTTFSLSILFNVAERNIAFPLINIDANDTESCKTKCLLINIKLSNDNFYVNNLKYFTPYVFCIYVYNLLENLNIDITFIVIFLLFQGTK